MFKKFLAILLTIASLLTITACGNQGNSESYIEGCITQLGTYTGLTIDITEEELGYYVNKIFKSNSAYVNSTTGTIGKIDSVVITTFATCEGKKVDELTLQEGIISLGTGGNAPGFDEAVIGKEIGKEFQFSLTLPDDYENQDLAGKTVDFTAKVSSVMTFPEMTDSTVMSAMYDSYGIYNVADFKIYCRNNLFVEKIIAEVQENTEIDHVMQSDIDEYIKYYNEYYATAYLSQLQSGYPGDFATYCKTYLNKTIDQLEESIRQEAQENAEFRVIMYAICEAEGKQATDKVIQEFAVYAFESAGYGTPRAFIKGEGKEYLRYTLTHQDLSSVYLFLRQNNTVNIIK